MEKTGTSGVPKPNQGGKNSAVKNMSSKGLDHAISVIIFAIFFLIPLFFTGLVAQGLGFEKMILFYFLVLSGVVLWVVKGLLTGELKVKRTPLDLPILIFLGLYTVSTVLSVNARDSFIGTYGQSTRSLAAVFVFTLFYYLMVNNIDKKKAKLYFGGLLVSGGITLLYSLLQLFNVFVLPLEFTKRANFNPVGSTSGLTMLAAMLLPMFVATFSHAEGIFVNLNKSLVMIVKVLLAISSLISLAVMFVLSGFTFWPAVLVGMVIVAMFYLAKIIKVSGLNAFFSVGIFGVLVIAFILGNFNFFTVDVPAEVSLSRGATWDIVKDAARENPLFGSGPSTFYYNFSKFKTLEFNNTPLWNIRFDSASGIIFELVATVGILGTLTFIVVGLILLSMIFISLIKPKDKEMNSLLLGIFASYVIAIILSALFALNNSMILFMVLVGVLAASTAVMLYPEEFSELKLSFRSSPKYALALAAITLTVCAGVVVLFTVGIKLYVADVYAREAIDTQDNAAKIKYLSDASELVPYRAEYRADLANVYMAVANQEAIGGKDQTAIQNSLALAIESGKEAVNITPNKAKTNESLALIYENASFYTRGALEWSEKYYEKVIELDPNNPTPHLRIALINMARSNAETDETEKKFYIDEAIKKYDEALAKKENLASAHYGKAIAHEKLGSLDEAIESLRQANILARNNIDYRFELGRLFFNRGVSQPNIQQNATKTITKQEVDPETGEVRELSVEVDDPAGATIKVNNDLINAEQLFASIVEQNPKHANALYSLAILYQKTGNKDAAGARVQQLLGVLGEGPTKEAVKKQFEGLF